MNDYNTLQGRDPHLWQLAQKRASFKSHLASYLIINIFLWLLWYFTGSRNYNQGLPWPVWPTLGWGIGIAFHYMGAYTTSGQSSVEKEYEKLMSEKNNSSNK